MPGLKEPLAAFEQAPPPPRRPAGALPRRRSSIMLKKTQGSDNSRRSRPGEDLCSSPGHLIPPPYPSAALFQANCRPIRPPLPRRPAAIRHRRPGGSLAGEMVQSPAAANTLHGVRSTNDQRSCSLDGEPSPVALQHRAVAEGAQARAVATRFEQSRQCAIGAQDRRRPHR